MNPLYNKACKFIFDKCGLQLEEGFYWLDNQIVKVFDKEGNIHFVHRLKVEDDLSMTYKTYPKKRNDLPYEVASWDEIIDLNKDRLDKLESASISLLKEYGANTDRLIVDTNSTGKDSEVKTYLGKKAGLEFKTYFNVTTMDVAESNRMAREKGYEFTYPDEDHRSFYDWQKKENIIPSRLNRCCCLYFKEGATINAFSSDEKILFLFGMRNDESTNRSGYTDVWVNHKWGDKRDWIGLLPIRKWTDIDIWLYMMRENIAINEKYKMGYDRVGCGIVCPNYSKSTWVLDEYWYPTMFARWRKILTEDFIKNNKWLIMNCTIEEYVQKAWNGGVFRAEPTEEVIQEYAIHSELDYEVAAKYFNRYCCNGCLNKRHMPQKIKDREVLSMNLKLFGRQIEKFQCKKCLLKDLGWSKGWWDNKVADFKSQGCQLF